MSRLQTKTSTICDRMQISIDRLVSQHQNERSTIKPKYRTMAISTFKEQLALVWTSAQAMSEVIDTPQKWHYVRALTDLFNQVSCWKTKEELWNSYATLSLMIAAGRIDMTDYFVQEHRLNPHIIHAYQSIQVKQEEIKQELARLRAQISRSLRKYPPLAFSITMKSLLSIIQTLVDQGLQSLRSFYGWKKIFFQYQLDDFAFIQSFYDLRPTDQQVRRCGSIDFFGFSHRIIFGLLDRVS